MASRHSGLPENRSFDPAERKKLVIDLQKLVLENAYYMPGLWWTRNVVHWAKVKDCVAPPSQFANQEDSRMCGCRRTETSAVTRRKHGRRPFMAALTRGRCHMAARIRRRSALLTVVALGVLVGAVVAAIPAERKKLVIELQKLVLENAYYMPGLWWTRNVVHWAKVKNYVAPPSQFANQKLQDVWLSED